MVSVSSNIRRAESESPRRASTCPIAFETRAAAARSPASTKMALPSSSAGCAFCQIAELDERRALLILRLGDQQPRASFVRPRAGAQRRRQRALEIRKRRARRSTPRDRCADPSTRAAAARAGRPASRARPCLGLTTRALRRAAGRTRRCPGRSRTANGRPGWPCPIPGGFRESVPRSTRRSSRDSFADCSKALLAAAAASAS